MSLSPYRCIGESDRARQLGRQRCEFKIADAGVRFVVELEPEHMLVVPPLTPHGFRNVGDEPLLVVSVHEGPAVDQTFLGREPA